MKVTIFFFIFFLLYGGLSMKGQSPMMVKDIRVGPLASNPYNLVEVGNLVFFIAETAAHGREVWRSDGTAAGTMMVKDIDPVNNVYHYPESLTAMGNNLYFVTEDGVHGEELWKTDGTTAGTVMVKDINPSTTGVVDGVRGYKASLTVMGNTLYFIANNGVNGDELWKTDGTTAGTVMVKDINSNNANNNYYPRNLTIFNNELYFSAENNHSTGVELWKTDGTTAGTVMIHDYTPGIYASSSPSNFVVVNNELFFTILDGSSGYELWKTNGTAAGSSFMQSLGNNNLSIHFHAVINNSFIYVHDDGVHGDELWKSDGTVAGTMMIKDINPNGDGATVNGFTPLILRGNTLYFVGNDDVHGEELWKTDGTTAGTMMVKDLSPGSSDGYPWDMYEFNGLLYFSAYVGNNGRELWQSDGTATGTVMVIDLYPGVGQSYPNHGSPRHFCEMGNELYFSANNGVHGTELWKYDPPIYTSQKDIEVTQIPVEVYPNPTSTTLTIKLPKETLATTTSLYNNLGQLVLSQPFQEQLNVEHLPQGIYQLVLSNKEKALAQEKIVIHK
ncbi:MAG: ELWxxDGT repeat protein [Aureispira sp.]